MPARDPLVYVMHMRDCCLRIIDYAAQGGPDWPAKAIFMDAICRNVEIIGEAARKLDDSFHEAHPEIPWSSIIGARNIVIHAYEYLRPQLIRDIVESDIPELLDSVRRILD